VIFLAGTAEFWSYERSDTLVRMSVNTSGEKSETLVRYTKQNHTLTVRKKDENTISHSLSLNMVLDTSGLESVYDWNLTLRDLTFTDWIRILRDLTSWELTIGNNW